MLSLVCQHCLVEVAILSLQVLDVVWHMFCSQLFSDFDCTWQFDVEPWGRCRLCMVAKGVKATPKGKAKVKKELDGASSCTKLTTAGGVHRSRSVGGFYVPLKTDDPVLKGAHSDLAELCNLVMQPAHLCHCRDYIRLIAGGRALNPEKKVTKRQSVENLEWNKDGKWVFMRDLPACWARNMLSQVDGLSEDDLDAVGKKKGQSQTVLLWLANLSVKGKLPTGFHHQPCFESWLLHRIDALKGKVQRLKDNLHVTGIIGWGKIGFYKVVEQDDEYMLERTDFPYSSEHKVCHTAALVEVLK